MHHDNDISLSQIVGCGLPVLPSHTPPRMQVRWRVKVSVEAAAGQGNAKNAAPSLVIPMVSSATVGQLVEELAKRALKHRHLRKFNISEGSIRTVGGSLLDRGDALMAVLRPTTEVEGVDVAVVLVPDAAASAGEDSDFEPADAQPARAAAVGRAAISTTVADTGSEESAEPVPAPESERRFRVPDMSRFRVRLPSSPSFGQGKRSTDQEAGEQPAKADEAAGLHCGLCECECARGWHCHECEMMFCDECHSRIHLRDRESNMFAHSFEVGRAMTPAPPAPMRRAMALCWPVLPVTLTQLRDETRARPPAPPPPWAAHAGAHGSAMHGRAARRVRRAERNSSFFADYSESDAVRI